MPLELAEPSRLSDIRHFVFEDVSWSFYEHMLDEVGNDAVRVTFDDGRLEIMPPLPQHESVKKTIGRFIELLCMEIGQPFASYGSTTFKRIDRLKGLEPDDCYYFKNESRMRGKRRIDLAVDPAPELSVEIDVSNRSVDREPIYAGLGMPELWRWTGDRLICLHLEGGTYAERRNSLAFSFLAPAELTPFVLEAVKSGDLAAAQKFVAWARSNTWGPSTKT